MYVYKTTVVTLDGYRQFTFGKFANAWDAIEMAIDTFANVRSISARRLS